MLPVEDAICLVLQHTKPLPIENVELKPSVIGRILAESLYSSSPFPPFRASIMDGYAVSAPLNSGIYPITGSSFAGDNPSEKLAEGQVCYITTGGVVPDGATAVVKIEDTEKVDNNKVKINIDVPTIGVHIREIGSDIALGEEVLSKGQVLGPAELGLLATTGHTKIKCYSKPIIGVVSTGNELVDPWEETTGGQIRDSNRISLISSFLESGYEVKDYGIFRDVQTDLKSFFLKAIEECDVIVSSGGVSMGAADYIKPILTELGQVHFNKLNMKPGKPTVFATLNKDSKQTLFFGLPGNPVSCLVTKALFIEPALKRLQGLPSASCLHTQVNVQIVGEPLIMDHERPEYHRVNISYPSPSDDMPSNTLIARSTGFQRSSRLMSMKSSNGFVILPQGKGRILPGTTLPALLTRALEAPPVASSLHSKAARVDDDMQHIPCCEKAPVNEVEWKTIRTAILTISDRAYEGIYADESGPEIRKQLFLMNEIPNYPLKFIVTQTSIVPDEPEQIRRMIESWSDQSSNIDLILTTGGTGFGPRDFTPETIRPLLHREAPGIAQALLSEGLKFTPLAVLSRPVVGTRNKTFIATLPGSVKAVKENIIALKDLLYRIMELLKTNTCQK